MATQARIPVAQPIPVAYPVAVVQAQARAREEEELRREGAVRHDLKGGETVASLAMRYGVSVSSVQDSIILCDYRYCSERKNPSTCTQQVKQTYCTIE